MRIWDVNPGYLKRQSLLGEHRELHAIFPLLKTTKKVIPDIRRHFDGKISAGLSVSATDY
jgi:hypothetical protein